MRIRLDVTYDGTDFCGWQVQKNGVSVQQVLEDAIFSLTGERTRVTGSGRTDAGVHAKCQVAHVDLQKCTIPPERFYLALNTLLPSQIKVVNSSLANDDFDACRKAKRKTYEYNFYLSNVELPLKERYALRIDQNVDIQKMQGACKLFEGTKDFECVSASGKSVKTTVRTVYTISVERQGQDLKLSITGNGFLYNMVRIIAGTILEIGKGTKTEQDVLEMFKKKQRALGGKTLPAKGLCLVGVEYENS